MNGALVLSAVVQAAATFLLVVITWRYVTLTKNLLELQIDPRLDFEVPRDALTNRSQRAAIVNRSGCVVEDIHLAASVGFRGVDGGVAPIMKCIDTRDWTRTLKPKERVEFDIAQYFDTATEIRAIHDTGDSVELIRGTVILGLSFRRAVDGREFAFEEPYSAIPGADGSVSIGKAGIRRETGTLDKFILRRKRS